MADKEKQEDLKDSSTQEKSSQSAIKKIALLNQATEINLNLELPDFSVLHLKAYDAQSAGQNCFAILTDEAFSARVELCDVYKQIANAEVPDLMDYGLAYFESGAPAGHFIVYKKNLGKKLYKPDDVIAPSWKPEHVLERIFSPLIHVLKDMQMRDIVHGNIRADNLFDGNETNWKHVKLGEFLALPPSYAQPVIYEAIERGMADPLGRGKGTLSDDLYALGVLMAIHLRSYDPLRGKTEREIISSKIIHGSYSAIMGSNENFSGPILELLRGLLVDDAKQRWDIEDVLAWMDGRRLTPKQVVKHKKAARALTFKGTSYYYSATLALNLPSDQQNAVQIIENNELNHWVERSLSDEDMNLRVEGAIRGASEGGKGAGYWDRLISRTCIAMNPSAPIHYKSMSFFIDGFGKMLSHAFITGTNISKFKDFFQDNIIIFWIQNLTELNFDVSHQADQMEKSKQFLKSNNLLGGIERCLYYLNKSVHCLSPFVRQYNVKDSIEYIRALEKYASNNQDSLPERIIDKHAACFLAERDRSCIEPYVYDINAKENYRYIFASMQILGSIQRKNSLEDFPHINAWLAKYADPLIKRFHDSKLRKKVKIELEKEKTSGRINRILKIFENPQRIRDDQLSFKKALADYARLDNELKNISIKLDNPKFYAEKTGREWAVTISGVVSTLIILGFIMVQMGTDQPF